jgi:hypothetical protein
MSRRSFLLRGAALAATPYLLGSLTVPAPAAADAGAAAVAARAAYFGFSDDHMAYVDRGWSAEKRH